jgi:putative ABC transport system substrate-binding protein
MHFDRLRRREFIAVLGSAAIAWPLTAQAQQSGMPVIGFLDSRSPDALMDRLRGFRQGLKDIGYVEGENVVIIYRWAENQLNRLPALAGDLVRRKVAVIVTTGGSAVGLAAKGATTTIPIVFLSAEDPVKLGLVSSLGRPEGNLTGINFFNAELAAKQLELLRELVPAATRIAVLVNPANVTSTESALRDVERAARAKGLQIQILNASTISEIDTAFGTLVRDRADALFVSGDPLLNSRRLQLCLLSVRHAVPAIYSGREFADVGGLITYGSDITDAYRQVGVYAGRILTGVKSTDLPVMQSTKFELVINLVTARLLGLSVPPSLLATADEVIE